MGTEAQRLLDVSLGLLGLAEQKLGAAYVCMRVSQIWIQLQRPLALPEALSGAVGLDLDETQAHMGKRIFRTQRHRPGCSDFGGGEPCPCGSIVRRKR